MSKDKLIRRWEKWRQEKAVIAGAAVILLFGLWHGLDVYAGASTTNAQWLLVWYVVFLACGVGLLWTSGRLLCGRSQWKLPAAFAACAMGLGLLYLFVMPPLSAPDEVSHFISAYKLSNKILGKNATDEDGYVLIRRQDLFLEDVYGTRTRPEALDKDKTVILGQKLTQETYRQIRARGALGQGRGDKDYVRSLQVPVNTTPAAYVPQALGITAARLLGLGGLGAAYMGRFLNLLFYIGAGCYAIRRIPFGKEALMGAAILPMSLNLAASMSYDVMLIGVLYCFTAVCFDLAYKAERVGGKDLALLAVMAAVAGPCKMVYAPMLGLCLLIPVRKFGGWARWAAAAFFVLASYGLAMYLVNSQVVAVYAGESQNYIGWAQEPGFSLSMLLHRPVLALRMCYNTLAVLGGEMVTGMVGGALGNLDPVLNTPFFVVLGLLAALAVLSLRGPQEELWVNRRQRLWIWFICLSCLGLTMFSMLLAWTPVSSNTISGVQGRYFLPLLPVLLLTLKNNAVVRTFSDGRQVLYWMAVADIYVILRIFSIVCLRIS